MTVFQSAGAANSIKSFVQNDFSTHLENFLNAIPEVHAYMFSLWGKLIDFKKKIFCLKDLWVPVTPQEIKFLHRTEMESGFQPGMDQDRSNETGLKLDQPIQNPY